MQITRDQQYEIRRLISEDRKIEAIKYIRTEFGVTLRQAKRLADELDQDLDDDQFQRVQEIGATVAKGGICFWRLHRSVLRIDRYWHDHRSSFNGCFESAVGKQWYFGDCHRYR